MEFYLGTPEPSWLRRIDCLLFISYRRLAKLKTFPRALGEWSMDSCGFTELIDHGYFTIPPRAYIQLARRSVEEIGKLRWLPVQDWMCEPVILKKTGLSIEDHQRKTVESFSELRYLAPDLPWIPVLQGQTLDDYLRHLEMYAQQDDYLTDLPLVGVGSICRRQSTQEISHILKSLSSLGLRLHAFGMKLGGLLNCSQYIESSDSQAWSFQARRRNFRLPSCTHKGQNCSWCIDWAQQWRERTLRLATVGH